MSRLGSDRPSPSRDAQKHTRNTHINTHKIGVSYSFDPATQTSNRKKHGLDQADAAGDTLVAIVTAESDDHIRIISMRKADRYEQAIYRENFG